MAVYKLNQVESEEDDLSAEVASLMEEDGSEFDPDKLDAEAPEASDPVASEESPSDEVAETSDEPEAKEEPKEEPSAEEKALQKAEEQDSLQSEYTNSFAKILDMLGNLFKNTPIGELFSSVAAKVEKSTNPVAVAEQAPEEPVYQPAESRAQILELMTQDTDSVMETLSQAGMEATSTGQIENGPVAGIMSGLAEDMKTNPEGASDAILAFNTNGMGHIAKYEIPEDATPEEAELMSAHKDNATFGVQYVNQSNVEAFYYQMMLDERAGKTLSDKTLENMAKFTEMEGISVDYQHWCPGMALDQPLSEEQLASAAEQHNAWAAYHSVEPMQKMDTQSMSLMVQDVSALAELGNGGSESEATMNAITQGFKEEIAEDPSATMSALWEFNTMAMQSLNGTPLPSDASVEQIDALAQQRADAYNGLCKMNAAAVAGAYEQRMELERAGLPVPEELTGKFAGNLSGVEVDYEHWYKGCDVSVPLTADAADAAALRHEATLQGNEDMPTLEMMQAANAHPEVMEDWRDQAEIDFQENNYQLVSESPATVAQSVRVAHENLYNNHVAEVENKNEILANDYLAMGAGLQEYYNTSKDLIEGSDLSDSAKLAKQRDLASAMKSQVTEFYNAASSDQQVLEQFTPEQLDSLRFNIPGVNVSLKDYKAGMDISSGRIPDQEVQPIEEMSVADMARVDQKNSSDKEMEGFGYEVTSSEYQAGQAGGESMFVDTPTAPISPEATRTGEAQRKTEVPVQTQTQVEPEPEATPVETTKKDRGAQAEELFGNIGGKGKGKSTEFDF